jgi:hypothetical protein
LVMIWWARMGGSENSGNAFDAEYANALPDA